MSSKQPVVYRITDGGDAGLLVDASALPELFPGTPVEPVDWSDVPGDQPILARIGQQLIATYRQLLLVGRLSGLAST